MYSLELLMMDGKTVRNMQYYSTKINLRHWCIWLFLQYKYITMHGPMKVKNGEGGLEFFLSYNEWYLFHCTGCMKGGSASYRLSAGE